MASIAVRRHEFCKVSQSSIGANTDTNKSSVCLREVRMTLDKSIVHRYLNAKKKLTGNHVEKVKKQMKLTDYFKNSNILDCNSLDGNGTAIEEINTPSSGYCNNIFHENNSQMSSNTNNKGNFNYTIKSEPIEAADKIHMDEYCYDDLDVGEEFKHSDFLLKSVSPQMDVLNEQTIEVTHVKKKPKYSEKSLAERKKHFHCDHCSFKTMQKNFLRSHIRTKHSQLHDENGFITCGKCNGKLTTLHRFKAHQRICGTRLYYTCKFCPKELLSFDLLKRHVINQHAKEFKNEMELNEILLWCKSRQMRKAYLPPKVQMHKKLSTSSDKLFRRFNNSLRMLINMFCPKCNVISKNAVGKSIFQCLKCKTTLLFQCKKCKKTFEKIQPLLIHMQQLCKSKRDNLIVGSNKKALKIDAKQQNNSSIDVCNSTQEGSENPLSLGRNQDLECNNDLDIGEEFKYSEFLSNAENAQINVVREKETQEIGNKRKRKYTQMSSKAVQTPMIKRFECDNCGHRTLDKGQLKKHIKHKHSELYDENGIITCSKCGKKYMTLNHFNLHKKFCGTTLCFPCKFCPKMLTFSTLLKKHILTHHEKEYDAEKFNEILQWSKSKAVRKASNEVRSMNADLPRKKKLFRSYFDLNIFMKMYCSTCDKTSERELGKTKIQCLKCDTALKYQCQMCKKTYDKTASLLTHIRWYCKEREGKFNLYTSKVTLDSAVGKQHSNDSNSRNFYIAPVPKGSFPKTKIDYYYCNDCDYKSDEKYKLLHHIRFSHIESCDKEGSIICPKCRRKFKHSRNCKAHQLVCNASFDYKCTFCKFTAKVPVRVQHHIKLVHTDKIKGKNFRDISNEILKERKNSKEKYEATKLKKLLVENEDLSECFDLYKVIKMICPKCHVVSDRLKYQPVKDCSKCDKLLEYQCQRCGQCYDKYYSVWRHMKNYCRMIKKK